MYVCCTYKTMGNKRPRKTERIPLRVTPRQQKRWRAEADRLGIPLSAWIALTLDGHLPADQQEA